LKVPSISPLSQSTVSWSTPGGKRR